MTDRNTMLPKQPDNAFGPSALTKKRKVYDVDYIRLSFIISRSSDFLVKQFKESPIKVILVF